MSEQASKLRVTPSGKAMWCKIDKPDTKFKKEGEYSVQLRLDGPDAQSLKSMIDGFMEESKTQAVAKDPKFANKGFAKPPYFVAKDKDGTTTGETEFRFKQIASVFSERTNKNHQFHVDLFDSKKNMIAPEHTLIGNGSIIKVAFEPHLWATHALGIGVSLRLKGVQILELVEYERENPFKEEQGYVTNAPITEEASDNEGLPDVPF